MPEKQGQAETPEPIPEEPFDASDEAQVQARKTKAGRREKSNRQVLKKILSDPYGRAWLFDVLARCNVYATSFVQGDSHATAFNEGRRDTGLYLTAKAIEADPQMYLLMLQEKGSNV